jgi:hypothetical protein
MAPQPSRKIKSRVYQFLFLTLAAAICIAAWRELDSETLTMTTTYPSPVGIYARLITTGGTSSRPVNTILNRDAGYVGIGTTVQSADPQAKLITGGDMDLNGSRIVNGAPPVNSGDMATKAYVDAASGGGPGSWTCTVASAAAPMNPYGDTTIVNGTYFFSVICPGSTDEVISAQCLDHCGNAMPGVPANQGWQCRWESGQGCNPVIAYANCCH